MPEEILEPKVEKVALELDLDVPYVPPQILKVKVSHYRIEGGKDLKMERAIAYYKLGGKSGEVILEGDDLKDETLGTVLDTLKTRLKALTV